MLKGQFLCLHLLQFLCLHLLQFLCLHLLQFLCLHLLQFLCLHLLQFCLQVSDNGGLLLEIFLHFIQFGWGWAPTEVDLMSSQLIEKIGERILFDFKENFPRSGTLGKPRLAVFQFTLYLFFQ